MIWEVVSAPDVAQEATLGEAPAPSSVDGQSGPFAKFLKKAIAAEALLPSLKLELENAEKQGQLIPTDKVKKEWVKVAAATRSKLLALPDKCAPAVYAAETLPEIKEILKDHIFETLTDLSQTR